MRLTSGPPIFTHRPFAGQGVSLYANAGSTVLYRNLRIIPSVRAAPWIKGATNPIDLTQTNVLKTARVAESEGTEGEAEQFNYALPAGLIGSPGTPQQIAVAVRHFRDDIENEDVQGEQLLLIDENGDSTAAVGGTATMLDPEIRAGGIVRLRWRFHPDSNSSDPARFRITFTAGPTSPSDLTTDFIEFLGGAGVYELDTLALSDASAYTITLSGEDDPGTDTLDLVTGYQFTADASGPGAPVLTSADVV